MKELPQAPHLATILDSAMRAAGADPVYRHAVLTDLELAEQDDRISEREAAKELALSVPALCRWRKSGERKRRTGKTEPFPFTIQTTGNIKYLAHEVHAYRETGTVPPPAQPGSPSACTT
jgi:hypothetical protein